MRGVRRRDDNSRTKVQNVRGDSSSTRQSGEYQCESIEGIGHCRLQELQLQRTTRRTVHQIVHDDAQQGELVRKRVDGCRRFEVPLPFREY